MAGKRLSIRATAMRFGLPTRVISRAIASGMLACKIIETETGRHRVYILIDDADVWFNSLPVCGNVTAPIGIKI